MHESETLVKEAKALGARGYISKTDLTDTLLNAVETVVVRRQTFFPNSKRGAEVAI